MENNIKKVMDEMEVPMQQLDEAIARGMSMSKKKPRNKFKVGLLSAVAVVSLVLGSGFLSPTIGNALAKVPLISFRYKIEQHDKGLKKALVDGQQWY